MTNQMNLNLTQQFCQTKTGAKIHACTGGSSRTFCGAKVARRLLHMGTPNAYTQFCGGCGLNGEHILAKAQACGLMLAAFQTR